jgi:hypothetical protein
MAPKKRLTVIKESDSGRNERFKDNQTGEEKTRAQVVRDIEAGKLPGYHVREIDGVKTPVSNPDKSNNNNLG